MVTHNALFEKEARGYMETLFPTLAADEHIEVRYRAQDKPMRRRFFRSKQEAVQFALRLRHDHDVYVGVAPRQGNIGTKEGVTRLQAIWADLDAKGAHTRETRFKQLTDLPYLPSIMIWTGGGWHVYWLLEETADGQEELAEAEAVMRRLAEGLEGDHVGDRTRILRLPGTLNHKYAKLRPVELVHCDPDQRYPLEHLREMAEALPEMKVNSGGAGGKVRRDVLCEPIRDERNVALTSVGGSLRDRGLDVETIRVVLLEVNRLRCEPPLDYAEVRRIATSVSRYPAGGPRYRRSPAKRTYPKAETR